jgi:phosphate transport system permease protein
MEARLPYVESLKRKYKDSERGEVAVVVAQALLIMSAFVAFVIQSPLLSSFMLAFLIVTGYGWKAHQETTAKSLTFMMTASTVTILGLIAVFLVLRAMPALELMGANIIIPPEGEMWKPSTGGEGKYNLIPMIWGTAVTTVVAMLVAGPLGIAGAVFIAELAPPRIRAVTKPAVETLAGVPSIVYGFIGFTVVNTYFSDVMSTDIGGPLIAIGAVIGLMALPTVVSVAEDAISTVPDPTKDGSVAMGATNWQTTKSVTIPAAFSGVSAAILLGVGRAMGETMAATVMISHSQRLPEPLYDAFESTETLTTLIAGNFGPAEGTEFYLSGLFAAGVILFVIVTGLGIVAQLIERRMEKKLGGEL